MKLTRKPSQAVTEAAEFIERAKAFKETIGELLPAKSPGKRGQGRGGKSSVSDTADLSFDRNTIAAYRKIATNRHTSTGATIALVAAELGVMEVER